MEVMIHVNNYKFVGCVSLDEDKIELDLLEVEKVDEFEGEIVDELVGKEDLAVDNSGYNLHLID